MATLSYNDVTLISLRDMALTFRSGSDLQNHWGESNTNAWINEGVRLLWDGTRGIEDYRQFTASTTIPQIALPPGHLRTRLLRRQTDLYQLRYVEMEEIAGLGTAAPTRYTIFGKPNAMLILGPGTPDQEYVLQHYFYRTPKLMVNDTDAAEVPYQWVFAPAMFAAYKLAMADRDIEFAQALFADFMRSRQEMQSWLIQPSADNVPAVRQVW